MKNSVIAKDVIKELIFMVFLCFKAQYLMKKEFAHKNREKRGFGGTNRGMSGPPSQILTRAAAHMELSNAEAKVAKTVNMRHAYQKIVN